MTHDQPGGPAVCLDVGSTWTKALLVRADGAVEGFAEHPTTTADVLAGVDAAVRAVNAAGSGGPEPQVLACSSAGGGLRLAVVGTDTLTATEAGHQVARSAGARVVHVHGGPLEPDDVRAVRGSRPGAVLLLGGSDGDDPAGLLHNAARLASARVRYPIVLAGNSAAREDAVALLRATGRTVVPCGNVAPEIGAMAPVEARSAIAEVYASHVLGARGPASAPRFRRLARIATPDAVTRGAAELARMRGVPVLVVDVGCSTTDVHFVGPDAGPGLRTVEGDLGVRAAAAGVLVEGQAAGIVDPVEADLLAPAVERMAAETGYVPRDPGGAAEDRRIAAVAATVALRRHHDGPGEPAKPGLLVLSGGVFRQRHPAGLAAVASTLRADPALAALLDGATVLVDGHFALTPAGLLAGSGRGDAAESLLSDHLTEL